MATQIHRLFFALRPDETQLRELERAVAAVKATQRVRGKWLKASKLHVTVQFLGDFTDPAQVIARAQFAAASVRCAVFELVLDRALSFARRSNPPCVLRCAAGTEVPLQSFHRELGKALGAAGLGEYLQTQPYVPHLTIAYAETALSAPVTIEPIVWKVSEFVLMDSLVGQSLHNQIEQWPLRA